MTIDRFDLHKAEYSVHKQHEKQPVIEVSEGGDRKITRTYKRKWDEINHVQKVRSTARATPHSLTRVRRRILRCLRWRRSTKRSLR